VVAVVAVVVSEVAVVVSVVAVIEEVVVVSAVEEVAVDFEVAEDVETDINKKKEIVLFSFCLLFVIFCMTIIINVVVFFY